MLGLTNFASESGVPLAAETVFTVGGFAITNSMLMGVLVAIVLIIAFSIASASLHIRPKSKFSFALESIIVFVKSNITNSFGGDEAKAKKFLPLFAAFFLFILLNNLGGLLPGMGGAIYVTNDEGVKAALLRPFTTDLNGTFALAIVAMLTVEIIAIRERGVKGFFKHFFSVMEPWYNPMNFFIGIIELLGEFIRMITLAFRLFGVIYAGEVLLHVIMNISGNLAPLTMFPVILMEIFFSLIQAYLFIMLSSTYLAIGSSHDEEHQKEPNRDIAVDNTATSKA